ncbi:STAS domain-containing protein [Amantichitinum ursilacus]|uniref:STAS domain-containing protein n=1 Tax=Amantichitinum ursilacus TaxID=857265 RepID=A0A0N0XI39_9NEIS|nr:STAS domain-containing protein [Amantichitinum ursilacus]KPC50207.1 hypothetical protein WG78_18420 [Amantichitinum ursilacus]
MQIDWHLVSSTVVIRLLGNFTAADHRDFKQMMTAVLALHGVSDFCVDLADVDYLDSSALGLLSQFHDRAGRRPIKLTHCHGPVKMVLVIANYEKLFQMA